MPRYFLRCLLAACAMGSCAGVVQLTSGQERHALGEGRSTALADPVFSPDSKWLAVLETVPAGTDKSLPEPTPPSNKVTRITIWDVESRKPLRTLGAQVAGGSFASTRLAFSPDGSWLALAEKSGVRLWNTANWQSRAVELPARNNRAKTPAPECALLAFSPDGHRLVVGCQGRGPDADHSLRVWDLRTQEPPANLPLEGAPVAATILPDGRVAVVVCFIGGLQNQHSEIQTWLTGAKDPKTRHRINEPRLPMAAFSVGGELVAVGVRNEAAVWETTSGRSRSLGTFGDWNGYRSPNYRGGICALAFSPGGEVVAAGGNANRTHTRVRLWGLSSSASELTDLYLDHGEGWAVVDLAFSPDGNRLASIVHRWEGSGHTLHLWDLKQKADEP